MKKAIVFTISTLITTTVLSIFLSVTFCVTFCVTTHAEVKNEDKPIHGEWDFRKEKIWETEDPGDYILANIGNIMVHDDGRVYIVDQKQFKIFIFDKDGKFISAFGKRGEGPGECKTFWNGFLRNGKIIFIDSDSGRVHYFKDNGEYIKTVVIPHELSIDAMVGDNRIISVPGVDLMSPKKTDAAFIYNISEKSKKELFKFSVSRDVGVYRPPGGYGGYQISSNHITPAIVLDYSNGNIYYGMNNIYKITVKDADSLKDELTFSLERKKVRATEEFKDNMVKGSDMPPAALKGIRKSLPDYLTYFLRISSDYKHNIYVHIMDTNRDNDHKMDIFSKEGKYIYAAAFKAEDGYTLGATYLHKNHLYMGVETESGDIKLIKYRVSLPGAKPVRQ